MTTDNLENVTAPGADDGANEQIAGEPEVDETIDHEVTEQASLTTAYSEEVEVDGMATDDVADSEISGPEISPELRDDYFADDLPGDDVALAVSPQSAIFQQLENVISWRIEGLYDEEGNILGRLALRNEPPVLYISSADGDQAEFIVTRELAETLERAFNTVNRAYYGVSPKTDKGFMDYIVENPAKAAVAAAVFVLLVLALILL